MCSPKSVLGDVTKGIEQTIPGAKQIDQFLNKVGIGPADLLNNPLKPKGWLGDVEHGFSQVTHNPEFRTAAEIAAAIAATYFGGEALLPEIMGSTDAAAGADIAATAADAAGATATGADLAAETATAADVAGSAGAADAAAATAAGGTAATAADAAAAGASALPEVTVSASALPAAAAAPGLTAGDLAPIVAGASALDPRMLYAAQGTPGVDPATQFTAGANPADVFGGAPATADLSGYPLVNPGLAEGPSADLLGSLGQGADLTSAGAGDLDMLAQEDPTMMQALTTDPTTGEVSLGGPQQSFMQSLGSYLKTPKGMLTAGLLGMSGINALSKPKLPGAAATAGGLAGPAAAQAESIIQSGGYSAPQWTQQKASIDAQVDQEIKDATAAMQQNAVNSGQGGANSDVVQQQIAGIKERANTQRQLLYAQALEQNVSNAVSELTGADQTLMGIANLQYQQSEEARQLAAQLAEMAGYLNVVSG